MRSAPEPYPHCVFSHHTLSSQIGDEAPNYGSATGATPEPAARTRAHRRTLTGVSQVRYLGRHMVCKSAVQWSGVLWSACVVPETYTLFTESLASTTPSHMVFCSELSCRGIPRYCKHTHWRETYHSSMTLKTCIECNRCSWRNAPPCGRPQRCGPALERPASAVHHRCERHTCIRRASSASWGGAFGQDKEPCSEAVSWCDISHLFATLKPGNGNTQNLLRYLLLLTEGTITVQR